MKAGKEVRKTERRVIIKTKNTNNEHSSVSGAFYIFIIYNII